MINNVSNIVDVYICNICIIRKSKVSNISRKVDIEE